MIIIPGVPHYDGTESDDGSSYVEEAGEKSDDDWGSDWEEEEWEDCKEEPNKTEKLPSPIPPPKAKTPSPIPPPKEKTPLPPPPQDEEIYSFVHFSVIITSKEVEILLKIWRYAKGNCN